MPGRSAFDAAIETRDRAWLLDDLARALFLGLSGCEIWAKPLPPDVREQVLAAGVAIGVIDEIAKAETRTANRLFEQSLGEFGSEVGR